MVANMTVQPPLIRTAAPHSHNPVALEPSKIVIRDVSVFYGAKQALDSVSIDIPGKAVTAFIGPSGCGK